MFRVDYKKSVYLLWNSRSDAPLNTIMRKFGILTETVFISIMFAGMYGVLHDQVTYSISREYFTKYKYGQFGVEPSWFGGHRQTVAVIGFMATWWVGAWIGIIIGLVGLIYSDHKSMQKATTVAIAIVFITAFLLGVIGFFRGRFYLSRTGVSGWLPEDIINSDDFITVGSIHNYSYAGAVIGLLIAIIYMARKNILAKKINPSLSISTPSP